MIEIKSYPAKNGEALLVKTADRSFAMLVDGGYAETYRHHIEPDLIALAASGYRLDVVVATHVDADHISGLLSFFRRNGPSHTPTIIPVDNVVHNSLRSMKAGTRGASVTRPDDAALLREIRRQGYPMPSASLATDEEISARQGQSLSQLLHHGGYRWNTRDGTAVVGVEGLADFRVRDAKIRILSPTRARLEELRNWWVREIRRLGLVGGLDDLDDIFEYLCAQEVSSPGVQTLSASEADLTQAYFPDDSVTNGSSVATLVEVAGFRLLLLADAWADGIVAALQHAGPTVFDAIKISHHGSARNTSPALLALVDSPHFFISTNGEIHRHPDFPVLKAIVDRPAKFRRTLHFNYSTFASRRLKEYGIQTGADFVVEEGRASWITLRGSMAS